MWMYSLTTIGHWKVLSYSISLICQIGLCVFYSYSYTQIQPDLQRDPMSRRFLIVVILMWIERLKSFIDLIILIRNFGATMHYKRFGQLMNTGQINLVFLKLNPFIILGFQLYFMTIIGIGWNCKIYPGDWKMCTSLGLMGLHGLATIIFMFVFGSVFGLLSFLTPSVSDDHPVQGFASKIKTRSFSSLLIDYNERWIWYDKVSDFEFCRACLTFIGAYILTLPLSSEERAGAETTIDKTTCMLCYCSSSDESQIGRSTYPLKDQICQHMFHPKCIYKWLNGPP